MAETPSPPGSDAPRPRRERSTRYPGVTLAECLNFCRSIQELGVDGLPSAEIARALGYRNIKTNTFSAPLSAARQFGLLKLTGDGYALTPLALEILHPVDPAETPRLHRQALLRPPLYAELAERFAGKRLPEAEILGNILYHQHDIIATAKQAAAEAFLESSRFAGAIGGDQVFHADGPAHPSRRVEPTTPEAPTSVVPVRPSPEPIPRRLASAVRLDLHLWDGDAGKVIRLRAPEVITDESFQRFLQAFRLLVRVEPGRESTQGDTS